MKKPGSGPHKPQKSRPQPRTQSATAKFQAGKGPSEKSSPAHDKSRPKTERSERPSRERSEAPARSEAPVAEGFQRIYGKHPIREALTGERPVYKLWIAQNLNAHVIAEFQHLAREKDVPVQLVPHAKLEQLLAHLGEVNHQGLVAESGAYDYADWDSWITGLKSQPQPFVLVLDQIQDSHNLGAILRTAEAAGVHGVVIPKHGSVGLSETVAKASAGAIETVPVLQVTNLNRALEELQELGLWVMGLSANGGSSHFQTNLKGPIALVIGSEHKGLRPNVEKHCDTLLHIPMQSTRSLNASVAAAVAIYEVVRQRSL